MSQENVEIVRSLVDALNRRDDDALLALTRPDVEFRSDGLKKTYRGHAELREYRRDLEEAINDWRFTTDRFLQASGERVLQLYRISSGGRASGVPVHAEGAILWTFAGDRVLKATGFLDRTEALEAAGLWE
jgi:ketosteroid isomerase-like protein